MSRRLASFAPALAIAVATGTAAQSLTPVESPGLLLASEPAQPVKTEGDVYIVHLREASAASYKGETPGFAATKPQPGERFSSANPAVESYARYLESSHDALISVIGGQKVHSYQHAFNGFSARLTAAQVTMLAHRPDVIGIWRDSYHQLQTNNSSLWLGLLDQTGGLRADLGLDGEDVIVAVIDSGVDPSHPQLQDTEQTVPRACSGSWAESSWLGFLLCRPILRDLPITQTYDVPEGFNGICQQGPGFPASSCNNKLIGARFYNDGFMFRYNMDDGEYLSPKDADGHGTHISTIVAGNPDVATFFGGRVGEVSGIAPRARIAVYKACWLQPGQSRATCATSDLARAIDDAVADGADIINYSVGSLETDLTAPEDIALLNALDAGVLSVVAAGNDGPDNYTIGSPSSAPWVLSVAATSQGGSYREPAIEVVAPDALSDLLPMREASFTPQLATLEPVEAPLILADDGQEVIGDEGLGSIHDACEAIENVSEMSGAIALIERGGCLFQTKFENVEQAGAIGAVVFTTTGLPIVMNGSRDSVGIPAVMIGPGDGNFLVDAIFAGDEPVVRLAYGVLISFNQTGDLMAAFSSRGPSLSESDFIKPDLAAPGVNILAGSTPDVANGPPGEYYQYLSGTSMSTPMVAGIAALLKQANPDWSPGALKSALMTTAWGGLATEDGEFVANPFDAGAGLVNGNEAIDPGLVIDAGYEDFVAYLCGTDDPIIAATDCADLAVAGYPFAPEQINLPSIGVTELIPGDVVIRTVTNIGPAATYTSTVEAPPGVTITVDPATLTLGNGESAEIRLRLDVADAAYGFWQFGNVNWSDNTHSVNLPVAVQPVYLRAPRDIHLTELNGSGLMPVDFAYDGTYLAGVHGLNPAAMREQGSVDDDPTNNFTFRFDNTVRGHFFTVPAEQLMLRVSLFDALTDGNDDLDLYLYYCPTLSTCTEVGKSGSFTSEEEIDVLTPQPGLYAALVHGFQTDNVAGGPGANYEILAWSFGPDDDEGNLSIDAVGNVTTGQRLDFPYTWGSLDPEQIYVGAISHNTPFDIYFLTVITANQP